MKKAILFAGLGVTMLAASCKKDDTKTAKDLILGTWNLTYTAEDGNDNGKLDESEKEMVTDAVNTFEFKDDGTLKQVVKKTTSAEEEITNGTYTLSEDGKTLTVKVGTFTTVSTITTLTGSELFFYVPKSSSSDLQWIQLNK